MQEVPLHAHVAIEQNDDFIASGPEAGVGAAAKSQIAFECQHSNLRKVFAQKLRAALRVEALLVTRSEDGMTLYRRARRLHVPAQSREVYDVSGAGDTVIATLGVAMASGVAMDEAVRLANRAAGIVVGKFGTAVVEPHDLFATDYVVNS